MFNRARTKLEFKIMFDLFVGAGTAIREFRSELYDQQNAYNY